MSGSAERTPPAFVWPHRTGPLVGRDDAAARLLALLRDHPVVALHGPLGIGKTALCLHAITAAAAAGTLPPPAYASLGGVQDPRDVLERSAAALGGRRPATEAVRVAQALLFLLDARPCTLVWDDAQDAAPRALVSVVETLPRVRGAWRVVLLTRGPPPGDLGLPALALPPLSAAASRELLALLATDRGHEVPADLIAWAGGSPLLLELALLRSAGPPLAREQAAALTDTVARLAGGPARALLEVLLAAQAPMRLDDLAAVCGPWVPAATQDLHRERGLLTDGVSVTLPAAAADAVRGVIGEPGPAAWRTLLDLAERALSAAPADAQALLIACRARTRLGQTPRALRLVRTHRAARAAAAGRPLEQTLRAMAAADPRCAGEVHLILAREQLRWGDFEAARRTLDGLPEGLLTGAHAARAHVLRAAALVRAGEPLRAARELAHAHRTDGAEDDPAIGLGQAELTALRGDVAAARRLLFGLRARTGGLPALEGRRATLLGLSYFLEDRHDRALVWARRGRLAQRPDAGVPVESLASVIEVLSLLSLGRLDQAAALLTRYARSTEREVGTERLKRGVAVALRAAVPWRRGDLQTSLVVAEPCFNALDSRADQVARAVMARYLARAALGLGRLERAEAFLRAADGIAAEPGLGAFAPWHALDQAAVAEARGDRARARSLCARACAALPASPYARIEAWAVGAAPTLPGTGAPHAARAYARLRGAERALEAGDLAEAEAEARAAEHWHHQAGMQLEVCRARLLHAEALARLGRGDESRAALDGCAQIAEPRAYLPLLVGAGLVRAALADRGGQLDEYVHALARARHRAGAELTDPALAAASARVGLAPTAVVVGVGDPWAALVGRLGLTRPYDRLCSVGSRVHLLAPDEAPAAAVDLAVDLDALEIRVGRRRRKLPPQPLQLLEVLVGCGHRGVTAEELYLTLWGGSEYHPLRHRSSVYVGVARLRTAVEPLLGGRELVERTEERYRITPGLVVAAYRGPAKGDVPAGRGARLAAWPDGEPLSVRAYARRFGLPVPHARWELALLETEGALQAQ